MSLPITFTGTAGTELSAYDSDWQRYSGDTSTILISTAGTRARRGTSGADCQYTYAGWTPSSANYDVEADFVVMSTTLTERFGIVARCDPASRTFYLARFTAGSTTATISLLKANNASPTIITSYNMTVAANDVVKIRLSCNGTTIKVFVNDVERISVTDSTVTSAGRMGLYYTSDSSTPSGFSGVHIDNLTAYEVGAGVTGTVAQAQAVQAQSISGTVAQQSFTGTVAQSQQVQSQTIAGTVEQPPISGTVSQSSANQTEAISGTVGTAATTVFANSFPGANAASSSSISNAATLSPTINVSVYNPDPTETAWQQYIFGVTEVDGKTLNINVSLTNKETSSTIQSGYDGPWYSTDYAALTWTKVSSYSVNAGVKSYTINVPSGANTIYVASIPPLNRATALTWLQSLATTYPSYVHDDLKSRVRRNDGVFIQALTPLARDQDNRTVQNLPMYGVRVGNDSAGPSGTSAKREVIIFCGIHSNEWNGFHEIQGFVEQWLTGPNSATLLAEFNLFIYPLMSVSGNELGYRRQEAINSSSSAYDPNRFWDDSNGTVASIALWQDILDENHGVGLHNVVAQLDFHDGTNDPNPPLAWFNYQPAMTNASAINAIISAAVTEATPVISGVNGTTNEYFCDDKGVNVAITCEIADEAWSLSQIRTIGRHYCDAVYALYNAGHLNNYLGTKLGDYVDYDFETGMNGWVDGGGTLPWTRTNAATPTSNTGPDAAFTGSYYLFTESTGAASGNTYILQLDNVDFSRYAEVQFRFSRFVQGSTLACEVWTGSTWSQRWLNSTNYSSASWKNQGVDLSGDVNTDGKIRFVATMPSTNIGQNDNGIDFVRLLSLEQPAITGTVSSSQAKQSESVTGSLKISGTVASTQQHQSEAIVATARIVGSVGSVQAGQSQQISGNILLGGGQVGQAQRPQSQSISGTLRIIGQVSQGQPTQSQIVAGTARITGQVSQGQQSQTQGIAGLLRIVGQVNQAQPKQSQYSENIVVNITGVVSQYQAPQRETATGGSGVIGVVAQASRGQYQNIVAINAAAPLQTHIVNISVRLVEEQKIKIRFGGVS